MLTRAEQTARLHLDTVRRARQGYSQWQSLLNSSLHPSTFMPFLNVAHKGIMGTCFGTCQAAVSGFCRNEIYQTTTQLLESKGFKIRAVLLCLTLKMI